MRNYRSKDIFWGLLFIIAAVCIIINQIIPIGINVIDLVVVVVLGSIILKSISRLNFYGIFIPLGYLAKMFSDEMDLQFFPFWTVMIIAVLLSIGFSMIFKNSRQKNFHYERSGNYYNKGVVEEDGNSVNCTVSFGDATKYINSQKLEKAYLKCNFGALKVYFDQAVIPSGNAIIYLDNSFGETQLFIPKTWNVVNELNVFLGDIKELNFNNSVGMPKVIISGNVNFGDVKIIYI